MEISLQGYNAKYVTLQAEGELQAGDLVVMVSDGATASGTDWIRTLIEQFADDGPLQSLCDDIASTARLRRNDAHDDDITVLAGRLAASTSSVE